MQNRYPENVFSTSTILCIHLSQDFIGWLNCIITIIISFLPKESKVLAVSMRTPIFDSLGSMQRFAAILRDFKASESCLFLTNRYCIKQIE